MIYPPSSKLVYIIVRLITKIRNTISEKIDEIEENADLDIEPEDNFDDIKRFLSDMDGLLPEDDEINGCLFELNDQVSKAVLRVEDRREDPDEEWEWKDTVPVKVTVPMGPRSLFSRP